MSTRVDDKEEIDFEFPEVERFDEQARELLARDSELRGVVAEAIGQLRQAFGLAPIEVAYFVDPEDEESIEHAIVTVFPNASPAKAHETMQRVNAVWWLPNMNRAGGRFGLDVHPIGSPCP